MIIIRWAQSNTLKDCRLALVAYTDFGLKIKLHTLQTCY